MPKGIKLCISQYWMNELGKISDKKIARANNVSRSAICKLRNQLGIKTYIPKTNNPKINWKQYVHLLGKMSDGKLAKLIGCSRSVVVRKRYSLGIDCYRKETTLNWERFDNKLGKLPDTEIAKAIGCSPGTVWRRRQDKNILPFYAQEFAEDLNQA